MRPVHRLTKSPLDIFSTLPKVCFHCGRRFLQMHFLTTAHPHALVGRTHGLPRDALGVCVVFNRALDTLLMHHVSLGVIWIVTKRPSELFGLYQKHVRGSASVVPRVQCCHRRTFRTRSCAKLKDPLCKSLHSFRTMGFALLLLFSNAYGSVTKPPAVLRRDHIRSMCSRFQAVAAGLAKQAPNAHVPHRGLVLWKLSDDGPDASRITTRWPSSEALHTSRRSAALIHQTQSIDFLPNWGHFSKLLYVHDCVWRQFATVRSRGARSENQ